MRFLIFILIGLMITSCSSSSISVKQEPYLFVERHDPLHNLRYQHEFKKIVEDVGQINNLITLINKLPLFPGDMYCPSDNGVNYDLQFKNTLYERIVNVRATIMLP